jgi:hypothetical protein
MGVGMVVGEGATVGEDVDVGVAGGDADPDPSWQNVRDRGARANRATKTIRTIRALVIVVSS